MDCAGWHGTKLVNIYVGNAGSQPGAFWLCYEDPATTKLLSSSVHLNKRTTYTPHNKYWVI